MTTSPIADITLVSESQSNKAITINDAIYSLELFSLGVIQSRTLTTPPATPTNGFIYIPLATATGVWTGHENKLLQWINSAWRVFVPIQGMQLYSLGDAAYVRYLSGSWVVFAETSGDMNKSTYDTDNDGVVDAAEIAYSATVASLADDSDLLEGNNSAYHKNRANHTGTQSVSTITGLATVATSGSYSDLTSVPANFLYTDTAQAYTRAKVFTRTTLTDGSTISWDLDQNQVAIVTLGGNRTMNAPSNQRAGGTYTLFVAQDGTGGRTITWNAVFKWSGGSTPSLTTTANKVDIFTFISDGTNLYGTIIKNF